MSEPKIRSLDTTTLLIQKPENYNLLLQQYQVARYALPDRDRFFQTEDNYYKLRTGLRSQILFPYLDFSYDEIEGIDNKRIAVYVLYPKSETPGNIILADFSDNELSPRLLTNVELAKLPLHVIVKFLQAAFFDKTPLFAGLGQYFVHARETGNGWHVCLEIEITGAPENVLRGVEKTEQAFYIEGHAHNFKPVSALPDEQKRNRYAYYHREMRPGMVIFTQLPKQKIAEYKNKIADLYEEYSRSDHPAKLAYHEDFSLRALQTCRGYLLHNFTQNFRQYLARFGIVAKRKNRKWQEYQIERKDRSLPIDRLKRIFLYDLRHSDAPAQQKYLELLKSSYPDVTFEIIDNLEDAGREPVLILIDADAAAYEKDNQLLFGKYVDLKKQAYSRYIDIPKQSINVNPNSIQNFKERAEAFLTYPLQLLKEPVENEDDEAQDTDLGRNMNVALLQLYLKDVVMNGRLVSESLPIDGILSSLTEYGYVRKQTYSGSSYKVLLYYRGNHLVFVDLNSPDGKNQLPIIMQQFKLNWEQIDGWLKQKYFKDKASYDIILMPGQAIELETLSETVLYDYDRIEERMEGRAMFRSIQDFKLAQHYDKLRSRTMPPLVDLLSGSARDENAKKLYTQLCEYDVLLDSVGRNTSYNELVTNEQWLAEIVRIFDLPAREAGGYYLTKLLGYYRKTGLLAGAKQDDVQISKGIWLDTDEYCYKVGGVEVFGTSGLSRASCIRRFNLITRHPDFEWIHRKHQER